MTVLCGTCSAENRDAAKFCKGCGRKMAQAWPQATSVAVAGDGAAALPLVGTPVPTAAAPRAPVHDDLRPRPAPPRARIGNGRWIVGLGLGVAMLVLAAAWWGHRNKGQEIVAPVLNTPDMQPPPAVEVPAAAAASAQTADPAATPVLLEPAPAAPEPAPAPAAEAEAPASPKPRKPAAKRPAPPPPAPAAVEAAAPPPVPAPAPVRVPTPQESCAGRNFIARAQCMAEQCARPEVARHPQCEAVRQQQRIEEEKRNPTMAG